MGDVDRARALQGSNSIGAAGRREDRDTDQRGHRQSTGTGRRAHAGRGRRSARIDDDRHDELLDHDALMIHIGFRVGEE